MKARMIVVCALVTMLVSSTGFGAQKNERILSEGQKTIQQNGVDGKQTFLVFWKDRDAKTDEMVNAVRSVLANDEIPKPVASSFIAINVGDAAEKSLVAEYDVSRAPMPLLISIAPNGAVTKAFIKPFAQNELMESFASPGMAEMLKAMQERKLAFVCLGNGVDQNGKVMIPTAVSLFKADPGFTNATVIIPVNPQDASEKKLLETLKIKADSVAEPVAVMLAPPGMIIGQFTSKSTKADIVQSLQKLQSSSCGPNGCGPGGCGPQKK